MPTSTSCSRSCRPSASFRRRAGPPARRTIGKKNAYQVFGAVAIASGIVWPSPRRRPLRSRLPSLECFGVGLGGVDTLMFALAADTVEYGEWKTGIRTEGTSYSVFSFTRKLGQGVGAPLAAYTLGSAATSMGPPLSRDRG